MTIVLDRVVKKYGNQIVLNIPSLRIAERKFTAVVGKSGSGKSTLLNLSSGLDKPTSGEILIDGQNLVKMSDRKLSKFRNQEIGFVFQFFYLQPFLNVQKNIEIASFPAKIKRKICSDKAQKIAKIVGLSDKLKSYPRELSGGQIQRVAIARALMNSPKILFADEPTGNLDSENSEKIINFLIKLQKETEMTLIIVTHDEKIAFRADKIIRLKDGEIDDEN
jgi:ABC-type lipoprotein export system ATPase subunit